MIRHRYFNLGYIADKTSQSFVWSCNFIYLIEALKLAWRGFAHCLNGGRSNRVEPMFQMPIWENVIVLAREIYRLYSFPGNDVTAEISVIIQNTFLHHNFKTLTVRKRNLTVED